MLDEYARKLAFEYVRLCERSIKLKQKKKRFGLYVTVPVFQVMYKLMCDDLEKMDAEKIFEKYRPFLSHTRDRLSSDGIVYALKSLRDYCSCKDGEFFA